MGAVDVRHDMTWLWAHSIGRFSEQRIVFGRLMSQKHRSK